MNLFKEIDMRPKNLRFFAAGTVLFVIFLFLLFLAVKRVFVAFDPAVTDYFQTVIPRVADVPLSIFSLLGSFEFTSCLLLVFAFLFFRFLKKLPFSLILFGVILVFEFIGKLFVYHPGPPKIFFRYSLPFDLPTSYVRTNFSFPSGHMSRTMFLVVIALFLIWRLTKNRHTKTLLTAGIAVAAVVMAISRVYLGEHWASDVIGGGILGTALGFLSLVYY